MRSDRGVAAPTMIVVLAVVLLGAAGMSVDLWRLIAAQRQLTTLADGAATAAASAVDADSLYLDPTDPQLEVGVAMRRACDHLERGGDEIGVRCGTGAVEIAVSQRSVAVALETDVQLTLLGVLVGDPGSASIRIGADADVVLVTGSAR